MRSSTRSSSSTRRSATRRSIGCAALTRGCGRQVERLLAADAGAEQFLEMPAAEYAAGVVAAAAEHAEDQVDRPGDLVGPFRLIREIGRGGMGRVFLAERADGQFQQQVALKLVRGGRSGGEILQRFLRERQILARLEHPNIARLLDGGATGDGRPYFAMEYVAGEPITAYCDTRALDVRQRLTLFASVCDGVQYAHQNLVVHRDLKPSNALVTADGAVKLLDFGIAKVLHDPGDESEDDPTLTRLGSGPMTPEYAAPEQVRGEPVTTATDVYALGALAYELLTGRGPHRLAKMTPAEVERAVTERDVDRPSAAVATRRSGEAESATGEIARRRGTDASRLRRTLRGDLDTMVMRALQKLPARRYASAGAFADDIRRYQTGLPIAARRDSVRYRTGKFVRRHAIGVATSAVILLLLVAGFIGTAWQARLASREAAKAREVSAFLSGLFAVADPALTNAAEVTARELLDRGASRVETELAGQPDVQAEMSLLLGRIYRELGVYAQASPLLQRALTLRTAASGRDSLAAADVLAELARLELDAGTTEQAERLQREVLAIRRRQLGAGAAPVGETLRDLATVLNRLGRNEEAEALQREALALHEKLYGPSHNDVASDLEGLQTILRARGQIEPAIAAARRALELRQQLLGDNHLETATAKNNLAVLLYDKWDLPGAERLWREVLAFDFKRLGEQHPNTATVMNNLAFVLRDRGEYDEAEKLYRRALAIDKALFGEEHQFVATVMHNLGTVLARTERYAEARQLFQDSMAMFGRELGAGHWRVGTVGGALASVASAQGDPAADRLYRDAVAHVERTLGAVHPYAEPVLMGFGRHLTTTGRAAEAEALLQRVLASRTSRLGLQDPRTGEAQVRLGACLAALGRTAEARPLLESGYARLREEPGFRTEADEARKLIARPEQARR